MIVDGLVCSILKAISRDANNSDLIALVEDSIVEKEIKDAWVNLFSHFKDALDDRKIPIIEIRRQSKNMLVDDIVKFRRKKESSGKYLVE